MLRSKDISAVVTISKYLDELSYGYVANRFIPNYESIIFPKFEELQIYLKELNNVYQFIYSLLFQGHRVDDHFIRKFLPKDLFDAMTSVGLLKQNSRRQWSTNGIAIVPIEEPINNFV